MAPCCQPCALLRLAGALRGNARSSARGLTAVVVGLTIAAANGGHQVRADLRFLRALAACIRRAALRLVGAIRALRTLARHTARAARLAVRKGGAAVAGTGASGGDRDPAA